MPVAAGSCSGATAIQCWTQNTTTRNQIASPILVLVNCTDASQKSYLVLLLTASKDGRVQHFVGQRVLCAKTMVLGAHSQPSGNEDFITWDHFQGYSLRSCGKPLPKVRNSPVVTPITRLPVTVGCTSRKHHCSFSELQSPSSVSWLQPTCRISQKMSNVLWTRKLSSLSGTKVSAKYVTWDISHLQLVIDSNANVRTLILCGQRR